MELTHRACRNRNFIFVHMRSNDPAFKSQGLFWHCMVLDGAAIVAQDEIDQYTWHFAVSEEVAKNPAAFDAEKAIRKGIGGLTGEADVKIDEIIVKGLWQSKIAVADSFASKGGRVFLAGDSGTWFAFGKSGLADTEGSPPAQSCWRPWPQQWSRRCLGFELEASVCV
jgi:hypothetical protein